MSLWSRSGPGLVRSGGPVPVGLVPVGPVPIGPVPVGPVLVGLVLVGLVPVGPGPVGPLSRLKNRDDQWLPPPPPSQKQIFKDFKQINQK